MKRAIEGITICALAILVTLGLLEFGAWIYVQSIKSTHSTMEHLDAAKMAVYRKMFNDLSDADIRGMFFSYTQTYSPWVDFRNSDLNYPLVHAQGLLRRSVPEYSAAPENANEVFFFGGSTMQGVHVPDDRTLPSAFNQIAAHSPEIGFRVFNYGQPYYILRQEASLFFSMLLDGRRPRIAIFLDGLNDIHQPGASYSGTPFFSPSFEWLFEQPYNRSSIVQLALNTNIAKVIRRQFIDKKLTDAIPPEVVNQNYSFPPGVDHAAGFQRITSSYVSHVNTISTSCRAHKIICLFFLQPVPFVNYDASVENISMKKEIPQYRISYENIKNELKTAPNFYALDDAFATPAELPYVDAVHYSPYGNRVIAGLIHQKVRDHLRRGE